MAGVTTMSYEAALTLRSPKLNVSRARTWPLFGAGSVGKVPERSGACRSQLPQLLSTRHSTLAVSSRYLAPSTPSEMFCHSATR